MSEKKFIVDQLGSAPKATSFVIREIFDSLWDYPLDPVGFNTAVSSLCVGDNNRLKKAICSILCKTSCRQTSSKMLEFRMDGISERFFDKLLEGTKDDDAIAIIKSGRQLVLNLGNSKPPQIHELSTSDADNSITQYLDDFDDAESLSEKVYAFLKLLCHTFI